MARAELLIEGMHCAGCVKSVQQALAAVPGVEGVHVNLATRGASAQFDPLQASVLDLRAAVQAAGYDAQLAPAPEVAAASLEKRMTAENAGWRWRFLLAAALLGPILVIPHLGLPHTLAASAVLVMASCVQGVVGWPYLYGAWRQARVLSANMDTLVALGTSAAYGAGIVEFVTGEHSMMFHEGAMILTFITLGKWLEAAAHGKASRALRDLLQLAPAQANVVREMKTEVVPLAQVRVGETLLIRPGEKVPLDARIISGVSSVNEAWLTGEPLPVTRRTGETVFAGTINLDGSLTAAVTHAAENTALAQVIELVKRAQESKANVQRLADVVVAWFVPVVFVLALATLALWTASGNFTVGFACAVAVLVVACPCALGLATPMAMMVASGFAASRGILIKNTATLETAGQVTTVLLDKTGTITLGRPHVIEVAPHGARLPDEVVGLAAGIERLSAHPLASAVAECADRLGIVPYDASELQVVPGEGVQAQVNHAVGLVGAEELLERAGIAIDRETRDMLRRRRERGETPLLVALGSELWGTILVADSLAPHSVQAVGALERLGLRVKMISGDKESTARAVALQVGIHDVIAEMKPGEKAGVVTKLRAAGEVVAMVGDGINDAPALAAANLGIALGAGADIALAAADMVLTRHNLREVASAIVLAKMTLRTIWQNLAWAFGYNLLLLPWATGLFSYFGLPNLPPALAAAAMAGSSLAVVGNSLLIPWRFRRFG